MRVRRADRDLLFCHIVVNKRLDNAFGTALDVKYDRKVRASEGCRLYTRGETQSTHFARVPCRESASVDAAQRFQRIVALQKRVGMDKCPELLLEFQCAENDRSGFFTARQISTVSSAGERDLCTNVSVAGTGGVRKDGVITEFHEQVNKMASEQSELHSRA